MYQIRWIGQGGFLLSDGKITLAIDPYLSDLVEISDGLKRLVPPAVNKEEFHPNYIFLTHEHIDHLDYLTVDAMPKDGVKFLVPPVCKPILTQHGVKEEAIDLLEEGDERKVGAFTIKTVWADHTEGSLGALVTADDVTVYFTGDTLYSEKLGNGVKADVIECCINGRWGNMNHEEAALVAKKVGAKLAIPNHYGMFAENTADPADFKKALKGTGIAYFEMTYNVPFDVTSLLPKKAPFRFDHNNINVIDLEKSLTFYKEALGLEPVREIQAPDGSFRIVYLGDGRTGHCLELTWLRDWEKDHYDLGDDEFHIALVADDFEAAHRKHEEMGCICFENASMGIYFIADPDEYWIEIIPDRAKAKKD